MTNMFSLPEGRPDPAHWTRTNVGLTSPLWWPFLMAAGAGAAWWTYANWSRMAANQWTGDLQRTMGDALATTPADPGGAVGAALSENLAVQGASFAEEAAAVEDDGADAIDAAYAENLGPIPAPRKGAASKKTTATKTTAKKTAAKKASAKKAPAKKAARKSTR